MKFATTALLTSTFATSTLALVNLTAPAGPITVGDLVSVPYSTDRDYNLEFNLVKKGEPPMAWTVEHAYFDEQFTPKGSGVLNVTIPNVAPEGLYAFWLSGTEIDNNSGYANLTSYFNILGGQEQEL